MSQFTHAINTFEEFSYTGDVDDYKINLYTTLSEVQKDIGLLDVLATEEFVAHSTKAIENLISISLTDTNENVSLSEYLAIAKQRRQKIPNVLPVLR